MENPKILILDIETRPAVAYVWRAFKENVGHEQVIDAGGVICAAAKWVGEKKTHFFADWLDDKKVMLQGLHDLLSQADAVVTYNGDKFDLPKLHGEFLLAGLPPPPPLTSIDVIKTVRKLGFLMNRLAFVGPLLGVGDKVKHEGFSLWTKVNEGDPKAQAKMRKYNIQDVVLLEELYFKILPYIKNHPHLVKGHRKCGACGSPDLQSRGVRRTKSFQIQRLHCQNCGSWQEGARQRVC